MGSAVVAYTDPQGVFGKHEKLIEDNLRVFTNLHWRPSTPVLESAVHGGAVTTSDTTIRTVPHLSLQLLPEGTQRQKQHQIPGLNNSPLVQILIIETVPLDLYRSNLRQIGKEWFQKQVEVREPTGFVVVHATTSSDSTKATTTIWHRITKEFESGNCVQLNPSAQDSWTKLRSLIQEQLIEAFDARINMLNGEIKKLRATQDVPGWNFGTLFALHESLAWAYESMNLFDDSLRVYNALEAMVNKIPREKWPETPYTTDIAFIGGRDTLIDPMLEQKASFFDIQRHLLSRKISLLLKLSQVKRQQEKTVDSLADNYVLECITMTIHQVPTLLHCLVSSVGKKVAYSWLLNGIREIFSLTTEAGSAKFVRGKGDLALIERDALQHLGVLRGWSIPGLFNDISLDGDNDGDGEKEVEEEEEEENKKKDHDDKPTANKKWYFEELSDESTFQAEFLRLTQAAIGYFRNAELPRAVTRLTGQLVLIDYNRGNIEEAWKILQKTPKLLEPTPHKSSVEMLDIAMRCATKLKLVSQLNEFAWKILCLQQDVPMNLFQKAVDAAEKLNNGKPECHDMSQWFTPKLIPYIRGDEDGYYVEVELNPKRPGYPFVSLTDLEVTAYASTDYGSNKKKVVFRTADVKTTDVLKLYTKTFVEGMLEFDIMEMQHKPHTFEHKLSGITSAMRPLSGSFTAQITLAKNYTMSKRNVNLNILSPKEISVAKVLMHPVDQQLQLLWEKAEGAKDLRSFKARTVSVPVLVDHDNSPRSRLRVIIEYDGKTFEFSEQLDFTLAVSVDFQEYFRKPPYMFSQFMVKPFSSIPLLFIRADLKSSMLYEVAPFAEEALTEEYIAYDNAPISYVFDISKLEKMDRSKPRSMELTLTYRSLLWEFQELFYKACLKELESKGLRCYSPLIGHISEQLCPRVDVVHYMTTKVVRINDEAYVNAVITMSLQHMDPEHKTEIAATVSLLAAEGVALEEPSTSFDKLNSTMVLEVPDPEADIVHYVELETHKTNHTNSMDRTEQYIVGSVIPATLRIETVSFLGTDLSEQKFEYELQRILDGWSYTGNVKGSFKGSEKVLEQVDLIPNRSGELLLPNVVIKPVHEQPAASDAYSESSISIVEQGVVVAQHANNKVLIVPDHNMLAITF